MNNKNFAFQKINYIICAVAVVVIILGFLLVTGHASTIENGFDPDIFSTRRIGVAPITCFIGFILMIVGILYKKKDSTAVDQESDKE